MLSFATEFPVHLDRAAADFLHTIELWISGSPHTRFKSGDFISLNIPGTVRNEKGSELLEQHWVRVGSSDFVGARYTRRDEGLEWVTTIVFAKEESESWVGVRVTCESTHPSARLPPAKKPIIVRLLLNDLGGASDGNVEVGTSPKLLRNSEIDLAANLITGDAGNHLPVVYVSCGFNGKHIVNSTRLAKQLSGLAHVVVEPNRAFSVRLRDEVNGENVYGGTVAVYWPDGMGRRSFFVGRELSTDVELEEAVVVEVQNALVNRRPREVCTWPYLQEAASRQAMEVLKSSGSQEIEKYIETFDRDIAARDERLAQANKEIQRLQAELRVRQARSPLGSTSLLKSGREQDFYPSETVGIVRKALEEALGRVPEDSRRKHVLEDVLSANPLDGDSAAALRDELKEALRGSRGINPEIRRTLEGMGFAITSEGKHFKLRFQGDDRYVFTLPKTGSDHRGGLNAASDIGRKLF